MLQKPVEIEVLMTLFRMFHSLFSEKFVSLFINASDIC